MAFVTLREGESSDSLLKRFGMQVQKSGILRDVRDKRFFLTKGEERRRKKVKALRRLRRKETRTGDRKR